MTQFIEDQPKRLKKISREEQERETAEIFESRLKHIFKEDDDGELVINDDIDDEDINPESEIEAAIKAMPVTETGDKLNAFVKELNVGSDESSDDVVIVDDDISNEEDLEDDFSNDEFSDIGHNGVITSDDVNDDMNEKSDVDRLAWPVNFLEPHYSDIDLDEGFESTKDAGKNEGDMDIDSESISESGGIDEITNTDVNSVETVVQQQADVDKIEPKIEPEKIKKESFIQKIKRFFGSRKDSVKCPYCDARITTTEQHVTCPVCSGVFTVNPDKTIAEYDSMNIERAIFVRKEYQKNKRYLRFLFITLVALVVIAIVLLVLMLN